jgi:hypothetical protein
MVPSLTRRRTPPPFHATADVERLAAVGYSYEAVKIFCDKNGKVPRVQYR